MARSTRPVIVIKNIYTLKGWKRFHLPVTYLPINTIYPLTLRLTGIIICFVIENFVLKMKFPMFCSSFQFLLARLHSVGNRSTLIRLYKNCKFGLSGPVKF